VAILWLEQLQIVVTGHKLVLLKLDPACPVARAKLVYLFWLQVGSSNHAVPGLEFSIFKPGFDSR
jgi:hypothetical protein